MPLNLLRDGQLSIRSVVFGADLSTVSQNAGLYAASLAAHFQAELVVAHSFILRQSAEEVEVLRRQPSAERLERLERLHAAAAAFRSGTNLRVRTHLLDGDPSDRLPAFADSLPHALLVLGTHGGSSLGRRLIGSVAERCLRRASSPTLTVGPHVPKPEPGLPFRRMLYATDCSAMASRAAPFACALAGSFRSELKIVSVIDEQHGAVADLLADLNFRTRQEIDRQLPGACDHFTESRAIVRASRARDEILRYADDDHSDLLVLGVHRRASIELLDRNSVTIQIIASAPCPVLTLTGPPAPGPA